MRGSIFGTLIPVSGTFMYAISSSITVDGYVLTDGFCVVILLPVFDAVAAVNWTISPVEGSSDYFGAVFHFAAISFALDMELLVRKHQGIRVDDSIFT